MSFVEHCRKRNLNRNMLTFGRRSMMRWTISTLSDMISLISLTLHRYKRTTVELYDWKPELKQFFINFNWSLFSFSSTFQSKSSLTRNKLLLLLWWWIQLWDNLELWMVFSNWIQLWQNQDRILQMKLVCSTLNYYLWSMKCSLWGLMRHASSTRTSENLCWSHHKTISITNQATSV